MLTLQTNIVGRSIEAWLFPRRNNSQIPTETIESFRELMLSSSLSANGTDIVIGCPDQASKDRMLEFLTRLGWPTIV